MQAENLYIEQNKRLSYGNEYLMHKYLILTNAIKACKV